MEDVERDIKKTRFIFDRGDLGIYDNVYSKSNEDLRQLYSYIDFYGKNVLSVLGSGDQIFYAYMNGAKNVDAFDKNKLANYYYYLRLWFIKYFRQFRPDLSRNNIRLLLEKVDPVNDLENNAYYYWDSIIKEFDDYMIRAFFIESPNDDVVTDYELNVISDKILDKKLNFLNIDISQNNDIEEQYDVLIASNIHDWVANDGGSLVYYTNNLYKLLNDYGLVLISCFSSTNTSFLRNSLFRDKFEFIKMARTFDSDLYGYVYRKRR